MFRTPTDLLQRSIAFTLLYLFICWPANGCRVAEQGKNSPSAYAWTKVSDHAPFPESYNFPMFNLRNQLWAFHSEGNWFSTEGKSWTKAELPALGLRTAYQKYVQFHDAIYALGTMTGDYQNLKLWVAHHEDEQRSQALGTGRGAIRIAGPRLLRRDRFRRQDLDGGRFRRSELL